MDNEGPVMNTIDYMLFKCDKIIKDVNLDRVLAMLDKDVAEVANVSASLVVILASMINLSI